MLVTGDVQKSEYQKLAELVDKIDNDEFSKKYFIGVSKEKGGYNLITSQGNYKVEIGDLDRIHLKVKGFKTFVEKYFTLVILLLLVLNFKNFLSVILLPVLLSTSFI